MRITVWVTEGTWPDCVDAARDLIEDADAEVTLIHVREEPRPGPRPGHGPGSLFGRGPRKRHEEELHQLSEEAAQTMLDQARQRLGKDATVRLESGFPERVVTEAAGDADYLIVGRDGDRSRLGPNSLGKHTRFVIDHAPCRVLLIWPGDAPDLGSIPPPPPDR